jgi:hypothetical protein
MKLYTEEQLKRAMFEYTSYSKPTMVQVINTLKPIELLRDVEIGKIVLGNYPLMEHRDSGYFALGAMQYNKWLKEQIKQQDGRE